eukprot:8352945-Pyramimonas_sp.AAC.1
MDIITRPPCPPPRVAECILGGPSGSGPATSGPEGIEGGADSFSGSRGSRGCENKCIPSRFAYPHQPIQKPCR